jgi:hypothetical protein
MVVNYSATNSSDLSLSLFTAVPCVYIELLASQQTEPSARGILPWLKSVAEILNELEGEKVLPSRSTTKKKHLSRRFARLTNRPRR